MLFAGSRRNSLISVAKQILILLKFEAKGPKQERIRLREDLREAKDSSHCDLFRQSASLTLKEKSRRTGDSTQRRRFTELSYEDQVEQLRASVDFLVELCDTVSPVRGTY
ncbi:uncharacterized protein LOC116131825 [Pistacia vera]|uniref:uncharacterized protein LOC116131825 n=1 Tax=Pistacia vera TaxID=55513 RepID=UPI001262EC4A|nr:uncharacterized protein LOC116131825 [Pistacia vera]